VLLLFEGAGSMVRLVRVRAPWSCGPTSRSPWSPEGPGPPPRDWRAVRGPPDRGRRFFFGPSAVRRA